MVEISSLLTNQSPQKCPPLSQRGITVLSPGYFSFGPESQTKLSICRFSCKLQTGGWGWEAGKKATPAGCEQADRKPKGGPVNRVLERALPRGFLREFLFPFNLKKNKTEDFPGSPVVRSLSAHAGGHGLNPWSGRIPHAAGQLKARATMTEACVASSPCSATSQATVMRSCTPRPIAAPAHRS